MCKAPEQTFFQKRYTNGEQVHEKMLSITNHQETINKNHNAISPQTSQNGYCQKDKR